MITQIIILTLCGLFALAAVWSLIANELAYRAMTGFIPKTNDPMFDQKIRALRKVRYERVHWTIFLLGDPKKLFDPILFEESK